MKAIPLGPDGKFTAIDLFCGAGGVSQGFLDSEVIQVTHAVNHSPEAIEAHKANNPDVIHYTEDIRTLNVKKLPRKTNILWASAECTHYSIAKGGQSRDADSRSLPEILDRYIIHCNPDYFIVENVKEFLSWGPLMKKRDKNGKIVKDKKTGKAVMVPDPRYKKKYYNRWVKQIKALGYNYDYRLINAADLGERTRRIRYFGVFYRIGLHVAFPMQTHSEGGKVPGTLPWLPCRDILELNDEGQSIFGRAYNMNLRKQHRKPFEKRSQKRVAFGVRKYVVPQFIAKTYGSGKDASSVDEPLHTVRLKDCHQLITVEKDKFLTQNIQMSLNATSIDDPIGAILTRDEKSIITVEHSIEQFISTAYGNASYYELGQPIKSILPKDKHQLTTVNFITKQQYCEKQVSSVHEPLHTIVTRGRQAIVTVILPGSVEVDIDAVKEAEKREFFKTYFSDLGDRVVELLCILIKDIKARYLYSRELARATGFRPDANLGPTETLRKKHIGNAVPPKIPNKMARTLHTLNCK